MRFFGAPWDADVCREGVHVATPVGIECGSCHRAILAGDRGLILARYTSGDLAAVDFPVHLNCLLELAGVMDK